MVGKPFVIGFLLAFWDLTVHNVQRQSYHFKVIDQ